MEEKRKPSVIEKVKAVRDFSSDGCSMSPDLTFKNCCIEHDLSYRLGLTKRSTADKNLRKCIAMHRHPILSWVYWIAVRIFGGLYFNKKKYDKNFKNKRKH